jgi:MoxR-like ATPase
MTEEFQQRVDLSELRQAVEAIRSEVQKIIVGQQGMIDLLIAALLAEGHVLIEGVPGIAKTLTAKLIARTLSTGFSRIQFTPDLMPIDVLGTSIFNVKTSEFEFREGPIFSNMILIDEINRAPAKTQSALFEVMEERQVTTDGTTRVLGRPFMVIATQNPIDQEGTYQLPEAQLDRFLFKIRVDYPSLEEEKRILTEFDQRRDQVELDVVQPVLAAAQVLAYQGLIKSVHVETNLVAYIAQIVHQTRNHPSLYLGASPRASLAILAGSKATAAMQGRDFVTPEDIRTTTYPALRHRILPTPEKEMEGVGPEEIIKQIVEQIEVPR